MDESIHSDFPPTATDREKFISLTKRLIDILVDFCLLTLRTISKKKQALLNSAQIDEIIDFDLQFRIQQIKDHELLNLVREQASSKFKQEQKRLIRK